MFTSREIRLEDVRGQFVDVYEGETVKFTFDASNFYRNSFNDTPTPFYNPEVIDVDIDGPKGSSWFRHKPGDVIRLISGGEIDSIDLSSYPTPHPIAPPGPAILFNWSRIDENGVASWEYTFAEDDFMEGDKVSQITSNGFYDSISPNLSQPEVVDFNLVLRDTTTPEPEPTVDDVISDDYEVPVIEEQTVRIAANQEPTVDVIDSVTGGAGVDSISIVDTVADPYVPPGYEIKPEHLLPIAEYVPSPEPTMTASPDSDELPEFADLPDPVETVWTEVERIEPEPVAPVVQHVQNVQNITNNYYNFGTINNTTIVNDYFFIETVSINLPDAITGDSRKKELVMGTDGDDLIADSHGKDYLIGGEGADQFYFAGEQPFKKKIADSIVDFNSTEGDSIVIAEDVINYPADPSIGIASNKRNLKQLSKEGYDLLYLESKGNLYVDGNGYAKGFGNKYIGGMIVDLPNETVLTESDILIGM